MTDADLDSPRCTRCLGPWHPATGSYYSERTRFCGPCERTWWGWVRGRLHWLGALAQHVPGRGKRKRMATNERERT